MDRYTPPRGGLLQALKKIALFFSRKDDPSYFWKLREKAISTKSSFLKYYYIFHLRKIERKFNCFLPVTAQIDGMPVFQHGLSGIFISELATIGKGCVILQQVTIGSNSFGDSNKGAPVIGDNVFIGAGAKIIGNVKVGDNVRIGANCVVVKDVPENSTVVLPPARIIEHTEKRANAIF